MSKIILHKTISAIVTNEQLSDLQFFMNRLRIKNPNQLIKRALSWYVETGIVKEIQTNPEYRLMKPLMKNFLRKINKMQNSKEYQLKVEQLNKRFSKKQLEKINEIEKRRRRFIKSLKQKHKVGRPKKLKTR